MVRPPLRRGNPSKLHRQLGVALILSLDTPDSDNPFRVEFFDTEVDSIRIFDIDTQRSIENLKYIEVFPAEQMLADKTIFEHAADRLYRKYSAQARRLIKKGDEYLDAAEHLEKRRDELCEYIKNVSNLQMLENYLQYFYEETEYLWDYMEKGIVFVEDPERICEFLDVRTAEIKDDYNVMIERGQIIPEDLQVLSGKEDFYNIYKKESVFVLTPFTKMIKGVSELTEVHNITSRQVVSFNGKMDILEAELKEYIKKKYKITIVASTQERLDNLKEFTERAGLSEKILFRTGSLT